MRRPYGPLLLAMALGMLLLFVLQTLLSFGSHYLVSWVGERTVTDLRKQVYAHLNLLSLRFFTDRKLGELTSRLTNDVGAVRTAVAESMAARPEKAEVEQAEARQLPAVR